MQNKEENDSFALLLVDIQNLIEALGFEWGKVAKEIIEGPINTDMHTVLKSAKSAIENRDPMQLKITMITHKGKYDKVLTSEGEKSLNEITQVQPSYLVENFFKPVETWLKDYGVINKDSLPNSIPNDLSLYKDQAGYLVDKLLKQTETLLKPYEAPNKYSPLLLFANKNGMPKEITRHIAQHIIALDPEVNKYLFWKTYKPSIPRLPLKRTNCSQIKPAHHCH